MEMPGFVRRRNDAVAAVFDQFPWWMMLGLVASCCVGFVIAITQAGPFGTWGFWTWFNILWPVLGLAMFLPVTITKWKDR